MTAASKQASGRTARSSPPGTWSGPGMVVLDRNWRCDVGRDRPGAARRATSWWCARSRPAPSTACGTPARGGRPRQGCAGSAGWPPVAARRTPCSPHEVRIDLVGVLRPPEGPVGGRARAGDRLMPSPRLTPSSLQGADRPPDRGPGRRLPRAWSAPRSSAGRTPRSTRRATGCRMAINNMRPTWPATKRVTILLSPGRPPQARHPLRPGDRRGACWPPTARCRAATRWRRRRSSASSTLAGGLRPVPGVLPMVMAAAARGITRVFVPEPQAAEAATGAGDRRSSVCARWPRSSRMLRGEEVPEAAAGRRRSSGAALSPGAGEDRLDELDLADLDGHARTPVRRRGRGGRRPPHDAHRAQGLRQDQPRRADPDASCPT